MRKNTEQALRAWQMGQASPRHLRGGSIWSDGDTLWSYRTALVAPMGDGRFAFNGTHYSVTTTIHQNALRVELRHLDLVVVDDLPRGASEHRLIGAAEALSPTPAV